MHRTNIPLSYVVLLVFSLVQPTSCRTTKAYTRYDSYPEYCSNPLAMSSRSIPPLNNSTAPLKSRILQVNAIIRHGARTPWSGGLQCWNDYNVPPSDTSTWDCDLTTLMAPPRMEDMERSGSYSESHQAMFLFDKKYDSLRPPQGNDLMGTCQKGQLLLLGYDQEFRNGEILREAYMSPSSTASSTVWNPPNNGRREKGDGDRMHLYEGLDDETPPFSSDLLYYRADDDQRTLMSGQVLLRGLFGKEILNAKGDVIVESHTADRDKDVLGLNFRECPRMEELKREAERSPGFLARDSSEEAQVLKKLVEDIGAEAKNGDEEAMDSMLDCMMTTICNDKTLPEELDDFVEDGDDTFFSRIIKFATWKEAYTYYLNDSEYAKLAMGPFLAEVVEKIKMTLSADLTSKRDFPLMALYSGHDSTIMPILASLGLFTEDSMLWTPYASMLIIEIHAILDDQDASLPSSQKAFRLLYNGDILTSRISGCQPQQELCDLQILLDLVEPFAIRDRNCDKTQPDPHFDQSLNDAKESDSGDIRFMIGISLISCMVGSFFTFFYLTGQLTCKNGTPVMSSLNGRARYATVELEHDSDMSVS